MDRNVETKNKGVPSGEASENVNTVVISTLVESQRLEAVVSWGDLSRGAQAYLLAYPASRVLLVLGAITLVAGEIFHIPEIRTFAVPAVLTGLAGTLVTAIPESYNIGFVGRLKE